MDISELKKELLENKIRHLYVFTGEELALQDIYINKIAEISKLKIKRIDNLASIYHRLGTRTIIKVQPSIYVIREDENYLKATSSWKEVIEKDIKGNIIILLYTNVDKAFEKAHDTVLTQFDKIGASLLSARLQATTKMPVQYCKDIVNICGCNYGRIKNELYKLIMLARINKYSLNTAYLEAKKCNFIHEEIGDIIFDFTNAVVERNIAKALDLGEKIKKTEDGSAIKLMSVLYNSFRQVLMVQSTPYNERTEEILGLTKGQIYVTSQRLNRYNLFELVDIVKLLRKLEKGIKVGLVEEKYAMDYLLGMIL